MRTLRSASTRSAAAVGVALGLALPAAAGDLYREPVCLSRPGVAAGAETTVVKLLRWPYALEQPFHALPDLPFAGKRRLDDPTRVLFQAHGGVVLEGPATAPWNVDMELQAGFSRGPAPGSPLCQRDSEFSIPDARITTDPYTGNLFAGRFGDELLHLAIYDREGAPLAEIRTDIFFRAPLVDLSGTPHARIDRDGVPQFFWFAPQRLAGFVDTYRRLGGASYARFVADAFLSELIYRNRMGNDASAGPRLPYLPGPERDTKALLPGAVDNLRGLRTTYRQVFVRGKARKGGVSCALMPVLKMLEDRDCRMAATETERPVEKNSCPQYSAMALQTELFREHPETIRERGYALYQVFETLVERGLCRESRYPMLTDIAVGRTRTVEQFGARAEQELNRILATPASGVPAGFREFREATPEGEVRFERQLPSLCLEEMAEYRETHPLAPHDLVDLLASQDWFDDALPDAATTELLRAQKEELFRLVVRLLGDGLLVGVAGDRGSLNQHAVLAYGWDEDGILLMDSDLPTEQARRRTSMPAERLRRGLSGVTFLRGEVPNHSPSAAQLEASLEILPDIAWTHARLADLYGERRLHRAALEHLRRVTELDPARANGWLALGETLQTLGRFEEALEATRQAMALGLNGRYAKAQLGYALRKLGRLEEAERELRAAVNDEYSWEWRQLGWTLFDLDRDDEAEACFRRALEIEPGWITNHIELAEFLDRAGEREAAVTTLIAAAEDDFDPSDRTWIGNWFGFLDRTDLAVPLLESVLTDAPDLRAARLALARIHRRRGEPERAAAIVEPLIANGASDRSERIDLAYAQALGGDAPACRRTVEALVARHPEMGGPGMYELACISALNGDVEQALDALEAAFARGYDDYRWARRDPDLASLANHPRLERLFATYGPHER